METDTLPQNSIELKRFILRTVKDMTDRIVPTVSDDEQEELNNLYGKSLDKNDYDKSDCIEL